MKTIKRFGMIIMSILIVSAVTLFAQDDEPGPFERLFRAMRRAVNEPQHRSTSHRSKQKKTTDTGSAATTADESDAHVSTTSSGNSVSNPPNEKNTRGTSKAVTKKGEDLPYGTPVAGKKGFVTSPFSPNSGYIDVRGFAPGTPVKDPYTGKVFLTP